MLLKDGFARNSISYIEYRFDGSFLKDENLVAGCSIILAHNSGNCGNIHGIITWQR